MKKLMMALVMVGMLAGSAIASDTVWFYRVNVVTTDKQKAERIEKIAGKDATSWAIGAPRKVWIGNKQY